MGRKTGVTQSQERVTLTIELEAVSQLHLVIHGVSVHLATMTPPTAYQVFNALIELCPDDTREQLELDDDLHVAHLEDWFYVLNELPIETARKVIKCPMPVG